MAKKKYNSVERKDEAKIIATNTTVPFQGVPLPYILDYDDQVIEFEEALAGDYPLYLTPLKNPVMRPGIDNLSKFGVEVKVMKIIDMPDGRKNAFIMGGIRVSVSPEIQLTESYFKGTVKKASDRLSTIDIQKFGMLMNLLREDYEYVKQYFAEIANVQMTAPREMQDDLRTYLNFMIVTSPIDYSDRVALLETANLFQRGERLLVALDKVKQQINLRREIYSKTAANIDKEQREHFLRSQIRQIQNEIGEGEENDIEIFLERAGRKSWSAETQKEFERELSKLKRFNPSSPDYAIQYSYLDTWLSLPWDKYSENEIKIDKLEEDLDKDHYGLEKVKERIVEHISVLKLKNDMRSPILCLYGPPGVGKTSLCKSVADSIGREYARISLGGLHDETQIRGHRRTYIGALPGRIISSLSKLQTSNPLFVLDEIDKIGNDHRGDPAQALLEVLDPEQNSTFHDNYLDVDYDLSKVFFIATANNISTISAPLLDRMELIEISGYLPEEKIEIAKRHLIPKLLENHGFGKNEIRFDDDAIAAVIESYTRESGVRKLEKTLAKVLRKIAVCKAKNEKYPKKISRNKISQLLGKEDILPQIYEKGLPIGVVPGLAWTAAGGEILYFESSLSKGNGKLTLTGNMGDVMKESATLALQWVKANSSELGINPEIFETTNVHLHVPEGAVPKDGPSAGITMVCSIASSFMNIPCRDWVAMTGEATLSGKVLPVGGVKEKILAAKRAGIKDIILSSKNQRDIEEIPSKYTEGLNFIFVDKIIEMVRNVLPR